jgi:hypothetical protein
MAETVKVGSRLLNGLILTHPLKREQKVTIKGLNEGPVGTDGKTRLLVPYVITEVDKDFWDAWHLVHKGKFAPLDSGAIFEARTEDHAKNIVRDLEKDKRKTGQEPLSQSAPGIKPAEK